MLKFIGPAITVLAVLIAFSTTRADVDLWGHLRFGADIVNSSQIARDVSYAFGDTRPWVNHEWGAEVVMFSTYAVLGQSGLILLKLAIVAAILTLVAANVQHVRPDKRTRFILLVLTISGILSRSLYVKPQLFSLLAFTILLLVVARFDRGRRGILLALPPLMMVWVNLHGGWLVGLGTLLLWASVTCVRPSLSWRDRLCVAAISILSVFATLVNPYGVGLWAFLVETVRFGRDSIDDWQPIAAMPAGVIVAWVVSALAATTAVLRGGMPPNAAHLAIIGALGLASIKVNRLDAFFALAVMVLLGPHLVRAVARRHRQEAATVHGRIGGPGLAMGSVIVLVTGWQLAPSLRCIDVHAGWFPEPEASQFVRANDLNGHVVPYYDWGEYIIWHHSDRFRVSMDGRRETVYTEQAIGQHMRFYRGEAPAVDDILEMQPDFFWLPIGLPAVRVLREQGWQPLFEGPTSVILGRSRMGEVRSTAVPACRCFPGP